MEGAIFAFVLKYRYFALFPIACFEGPIFSIFIGFLIFLGYFDPLPAFAVLIFGDLVPDTLYYYLGRLGEKRQYISKWREKSRLLHHSLPYLERLWHEHGRKTMFWSKLAYGFSTPFLISAGLVKLSLFRFWAYCVPVTLIQYAALMMVGYSLGYSYKSAESYVKEGGVIIAVVGIIVLTVLYLRMRKYILKEVKELENEPV